MKNNRKFYTSGLFKFLLVVITLGAFGFHYYTLRKAEIQKMKEVLMYSREQALKQIEEDKIKAKNIELTDEVDKEYEKKKADTGKKDAVTEIMDTIFEINKKDYYKTQDEIFQDRVKIIQDNTAENKMKEKFKKGIKIIYDETKDLNPEGLSLSEMVEQSPAIIKKAIEEGKNDKNNKKYAEAYSEIINSYNKKVKNKTLPLNRKIKVNDIVILNTSVDIASNKYLKQIAESNQVNDLMRDVPIIKETFKNTLKDIKIDYRIKKENLSSRMIIRVGKFTNFDRKLVGNTINSTIKINQFDQITDYQTDALKDAQELYKKNIKLYRELTGDLEYQFPDFISELSFTTDVKVLDIVDDSIVDKYDLTKMITNTDDIIPKIKEGHEREKRIMDKLKQL